MTDVVITGTARPQAQDFFKSRSYYKARGFGMRRRWLCGWSVRLATTRTWVWCPGFLSNSNKMLGAVVCSCDSRAGEMESGRPPGLAGQPVSTPRGHFKSVRDPVLEKNRWLLRMTLEAVLSFSHACACMRVSPLPPHLSHTHAHICTTHKSTRHLCVDSYNFVWTQEILMFTRI